MMVVSSSLASVTEEGSLGSGALSVSVKSEVPQTGWINMTVYIGLPLETFDFIGFF